MNRDLDSQHPYGGQLEASWLTLRELTTVCAAEGLVDQKLLQFELDELSRMIREARAGNDPIQLEACLEQCQSLLTYYSALRKQTKVTPEADLAFPEGTSPPRDGCQEARD